MQSWKLPARLALMLFATSMLMGCPSMTRTAGIDSETAETAGDRSPRVCEVWETITYSRQDTPETQRQIVGGNAARATWCGA